MPKDQTVLFVILRFLYALLVPTRDLFLKLLKKTTTLTPGTRSKLFFFISSTGLNLSPLPQIPTTSTDAQGPNCFVDRFHVFMFGWFVPTRDNEPEQVFFNLRF